MLFRIISYGITVLFSGLMGFMSVRWWTLGVCGCCLCFSQCQDAFWTTEKLCQSSTWYNAAGHLFPCCVQKSSHCNSMINSHLHLFFSPHLLPCPLQSDSNASYLRAARAGNIEKVLDYIKSGVEINICNQVSQWTDETSLSCPVTLSWTSRIHSLPLLTALQIEQNTGSNARKGE